MKQFISLTAITFLIVLFLGTIGLFFIAAKAPKTIEKSTVGFGEASAIIASKCSRFDWNSILKGRCMDVYGDAYVSGIDLYSIELDRDANKIAPVAPSAGNLPPSADHLPGESAETVMIGARPVGSAREDTKRAKAKKQPQ